MKHLFLFLILMPILSFSQIEKGGNQLSLIVAAKGMNQTEIYTKAREWIYKHYANGGAVIQIADKDNGKLTCSGVTQDLTYMNTFAKMNGGHFDYSLTVYCKDDKFKILISDIIYRKGVMIQMNDGALYSDEFPSTWGKMNKKQSEKEWPKMKGQAEEEFAYIMNSLADYITKKDTEANF